MRSSKLVVAGVVLVVTAAAAAVVVVQVGATTGNGVAPVAVPTPTPTPTPAPAGAAVGASGPLAAVCANPVVGPSTLPAGAVRVDPSLDGDVGQKTLDNPAGSTFWLAPGVHTLGTGEFGQVVPKDGNTYLGAPGAILDGRGINRYAFTQHASNVSIRYLTIRGFDSPQDQGVVNHDSGDGWQITDNVIRDNHGAGMMAGAHQQVLRNCLKDNGQYGINAFQAESGITGLVIAGNEIVGNNTDDLETKKPGCGCTGGIKFWAVNGADVRDNWVHGNHSVGIWADTNNNDFLIENNVIEDNFGEAVFYEISYNLILRNNTVRNNAIAKGKAFADAGDGFPVAAVYLSEAGGEPRVAARTDRIEIYGNLLDRNWSGITAWENADRFCNSPANTSALDCTRVLGDNARARCAQPGIATAPLYGDCRWKTQRVDIHDNTFVTDPVASGCTNGLCGRMAVLSNFGTYPDWSPYKGTVIEQAITFDQANSWHANSYVGPWTFMVLDASRTVGPDSWTAAPYSQDAGSQFNGNAAPPPTPMPEPSPPPTPAPAPVPAPVPANLLDKGTAGGEGGVGQWGRWYSQSLTRSDRRAHSGNSSLQFSVTSSDGWGAQLRNYPGFAAPEGNHEVRFWVRAGNNAAVGTSVELHVVWKDAAGSDLMAIGLPRPSLTMSWQDAGVNVVAPAGARTAYLMLTGDGPRGAVINVDDIKVGAP